MEGGQERRGEAAGHRRSVRFGVHIRRGDEHGGGYIVSRTVAGPESDERAGKAVSDEHDWAISRSSGLVYGTLQACSPFDRVRVVAVRLLHAPEARVARLPDTLPVLVPGAAGAGYHQDARPSARNAHVIR